MDRVQIHDADLSKRDSGFDMSYANTFVRVNTLNTLDNIIINFLKKMIYYHNNHISISYI